MEKRRKVGRDSHNIVSKTTLPLGHPILLDKQIMTTEPVTTRIGDWTFGLVNTIIIDYPDIYARGCHEMSQN